nr:VOC family protein [Anoxynatronum buryatiense]
MNKIMTHLWFDKEAVEVGEFYLKVFENSRLLSQTKIPETPSGDVDSVTLAIEDHNLMMISAGPFFKVNPSVSFMVSCTSKAEVNRYWEAFIEGGQVMMPLDTYPFSQLYGWVEDKFGVSWQLMYVGDAPVNAKIRPSLMFVGENCGRAEEAIKYYTQMFRRAEVKAVSRYGDGFPPNKPEMLNFAEFLLEGQSFSIMDSAYDHEFNFSEGISFIVNCDTQEEIDYYWEVLSADPSAEQCGWLKDQFGVSWQIVPTAMNDMMATSDPETLQRVTKAFLQMKKFDLAELEKAYWGE